MRVRLVAAHVETVKRMEEELERVVGQRERFVDEQIPKSYGRECCTERTRRCCRRHLVTDEFGVQTAGFQ